MRNVQVVPLNPLLKCEEVLEFTETLNNKIVNQSEAVECMSSIYEQYLAGIPKENRPLGVVMLLGTTGTGKTRLAEAVAEALYSNPKAMTKINGGEFQSAHEISKLLGAPPGYVGHGDKSGSAFLSQEKLDQYYTDEHKVSVVLFDEIEKAHPAFHDMLLGILDKGTLTTSRGELIDFTKSIIIMTSNVGAQEMTNVASGIGFQSKVVAHKAISSVAMNAARKRFSPEFINRIDHMVVFNTLAEAELREVLKVELRSVQRRIFACEKHCQFVLSLSEGAEIFLVNDGYDKRYGARHLKRAIEKNIINALAPMILTGQIEMGDVVHVDVSNRSLNFHKVPADSALEEALEDKSFFDDLLEAEVAAV
jgi:ATP-dependent Clp protease ATP-binding subunit ClpA